MRQARSITIAAAADDPDAPQIVQYAFVLSVVVATFWVPTRPVLTHSGVERFARGVPYSLLSLLLGPWGVPFGLGWTLAAVAGNARGLPVEVPPPPTSPAAEYESTP